MDEVINAYKTAIATISDINAATINFESTPVPAIIKEKTALPETHTSTPSGLNLDLNSDSIDHIKAKTTSLAATPSGLDLSLNLDLPSNLIDTTNSPKIPVSANTPISTYVGLDLDLNLDFQSNISDAVKVTSSTSAAKLPPSSPKKEVSPVETVSKTGQKNIGKYRIDSILGHGAMGIVYKATDEAINRTVAIKTIHSHLLMGDIGEELLKRFKTEATAAARCQHHNIVSIYDFGQQDGTPYIVMEFVKGQGLDTVLKQNTQLSLKSINSIFLSICAGLQYAHEQNIIHRDIKPANIIVLDNDSAKIADFGIAKIESSDATQLGVSIGTPSYMAPEQSTGGVIDCRVDIFALGVIAFEMLSLCDEIPLLLRQYALTTVVYASQKKKIDADKKFTQSIATFLDKCLNPDVNHRFKSIADVVKHYNSAIEDIHNSHTRPTPAQSPMPTAENFSESAGSRESKLVSSGGGTSFDFDLDTNFLEAIKAKADAPEVTQIIKAKAVITPTADPSEVTKVEIVQEAKKSLTVLDIIRILKNIHPVLDDGWPEKTHNLLAQLDEDSRRRAYKNILEPKNISLTADGKFVLTGHPTLSNAKRILVTRILNVAAEKLGRLIGDIGKGRNILSVSDSLEAGINLINEIKIEDNVAQQKEKTYLIESFLYDFAIELRKHDFDIPKNRRDLTIDMIKTYIIEVFIKQKILNYWFSPMPSRELKKDNRRFINEELFDAAKVRRLSIVQTDKYFFLIGEVAKFEQDPYSVRRFLLEDVSVNGQFVYYNIIAADRSQLSDRAYQQKIRHDLSRVVTIQRQLHSDIIELVESFEKCQTDYLLPILTKPLEADGTNLQTVIEHRLRDYERNLSLLVLGKTAKTLKAIAKSPDDFEYLFFGLKSFIIELFGDVRDFYYQSSARWSTKSQEMEFKLTSYLRLLEKRKSSVFNSEREQVLIMNPDLDYTIPTTELQQIVDRSTPLKLQAEAFLKEAYRLAAEERSKWQIFWDDLLKPKRPDPKYAQQKLDLVAKESYIAIVRIPKRYKATTIYLEFEGLIGFDETVRHYAFPKGDQGIALLPLLLRLPEDTRDFDIQSVGDALKPTVFSQFGNIST